LFSTGRKSSDILTHCSTPRRLRPLVSGGELNITTRAYTGDFSTSTECPHCSTSSAAWERWVTRARLDSSQRQKWAPLTGASESSSLPGEMWPTTNAHDSSGARGAQHYLSDRHYKPHDLCMSTETWPSPRAEDSESCGNHPDAKDSLTGVSRQW